MSTLHKVLVVDDDPVITKSFERSLPKQEYVVVTASSGSEALEKLKEGDYDVVFTDIKMPGMSGLELAQEIKAKKSWTPVVIISGYGSKENQEQATSIGVDDFIQKPLTPEMIEAAAQKATKPVLEAPAWGITQEVVAPRQVMKNLAMLCSAPFIGLIYAFAMPLVGIGALSWIGAKKLFAIPQVKAVGMTLAAPFVGLAYVVSMPFIGLGTLLWTGGKTLFSR